jgi:SAM-dependent methyltransferase
MFLYSASLTMSMQYRITKKEVEAARAEKEFYDILLDMNYTKDSKQIKHLIHKAASYAEQIPHYSQWPENDRQFWDAEALCWKSRIPEEVRKKIASELSFLRGANLDIGAGSTNYTPHSVALDISEEMLNLNIAKKKIVHNIEHPLPLSDNLFDSATLVFVASYVNNLSQLFTEIYRVLKVGGTMVIVQSLSPVFTLHQLHYRNNHGEAELRPLLQSAGFAVTSKVKTIANRSLLFLTGLKTV